MVTTPAFNVTPEDAVKVDGKLLTAKEQPRLWLYHKPAGLVTTHRDEKNRPTVFQALPKSLGRVISVGRLDLNSEGLLLLTNDGELSRKLELPATGWIRRYRARVFGGATSQMIAQMKKGLLIDGVQYGSVEVVVDSQKKDNSWVTVSLKEGKNREIRKIFEHYGCKVSRLIRLSYGPFQLGSLAKGEVKEVPAKVLKTFMGKAI